MRKRLTQLLQVVESLTEQFTAGGSPADIERLQISAISERTGILPNNVSGDLNELFLAGHLLKIKGRPVYYLSLPALERGLDMVFPVNQVDDLKSFYQMIRPGGSAAGPPAGSALNAAAGSDLDKLIGCKASLRSPIRQAKAAILYPPSGLHTLISGQTGVGKSGFARGMYDFAVKSGRLAPGANMVTLNCANYADNPQPLPARTRTIWAWWSTPTTAFSSSTRSTA